MDNDIMDLKEAKQKKVELEQALSHLLKQFSEETGLTIHEIYIDNIKELGRGFVSYLVTTKVEL